MKDVLFLCLVLTTSLAAAFPEMAPFDEQIDKSDEGNDRWTFCETQIDLSNDLNVTHLVGCNGEELAQSQDHHPKKKIIVKSPGYPKNHRAKYHHTWRFSSKPGKVVRITFNKVFDLKYYGKRDTCNDEYLEIEDFGSRSRFCGYNRPPVFVSKSNKAISMKFNSSIIGGGRGFSATIDAIAQVNKPRVSMLFQDGTELSGHVKIRAGKVAIYCHYVGGTKSSYNFKLGCGNKMENEKGEDLDFDESEDTVFMSVDHSKNRSFPVLYKTFIKGSKDQICRCSVMSGHHATSTAKVQFHVI